MKYTSHILFAVTMLIHFNMLAQTKNYDISLAPFSTLTNDEFSPVYYKNGIVFCSNKKNNSLITYEDNNQKLFNMFYVAKKGNSRWGSADLLAKELTTNYNDGPATFTGTGDTIYFCRNTNISGQLRDNSESNNKLGIYSAEFINGAWNNIKPFPYNNQGYSLVTPAITPDGKRLYFASDMPDGFGGADLYYCDWNDDGWGKPVNMGPEINTPENESYPYANKTGKLFFSSDGHEGFGGKDLFYTQEINGNWIRPIHLDADINSPADDFGLVTDDDFSTGYFSSNRRKTDDIYSFTVSPVQFPVCDTMVKNTYCFLFYDEFQVNNDTVPVIYEWDFGNGVKKYGKEVKYCFPGEGQYEVKLNLLDKYKHDSIHSQTTYNFEIKDIDQIFINSPDAGIVNEAITFDGLKTSLPDFRISDYLWNFGEGFLLRGPQVKKVFDKKGEYTVQLGLLGNKDSIGNYSKTASCKKINIYADFRELALHNSEEITKPDEFPGSDSEKISKTGPGLTSETKKAFEEKNGLNSYTVKIYLTNDLSELQKQKIEINLYGSNATAIDIRDNGFGSESLPVLNKFINVLKENPDLKLEIAVHTWDKGSAGSNLGITEKGALELNSYFITHGIAPAAIHCKGYGELHPADETIKGENKLNKRIEFIFSPNNNQ